MKKKAQPISEFEQQLIDNIKAKRKQLGLSQADLAYILEVSEGFIGNVESPRQRGRYNVNHVFALSIAFKCPVEELLPPPTYTKKSRSK